MGLLAQFLTPDLRFKRAEDITPEMLSSSGFSALILDVDNTLVSRETNEMSDSVYSWIGGMKESGISCCLLSNNWHSTVLEHAFRLDVPIVNKAMKPLPTAFVRALATMGAHREDTIVVGDQLFTDVLGARLCVIPCILVEPLSATDLWYTRIFRKFEARILR